MDMLEKYNNVAELAVKNLNLDKIGGKAVCFVPSWERGINGVLPIDSSRDDEEFILREKQIFREIREQFLLKGHLSFLVIKSYASSNETDNSVAEDEDEEEFRITPPKPLNKYFKLKQKASEMSASKLSILPDNKYGNKLLKTYDVIKVEKVKILFIDYSEYLASTLKPFLDYINNYGTEDEDKKVIGKKLLLNNFFKNVSFDVIVDTYLEIAKLIKKIDSNTLTVADRDLIEYNSINHLQHINLPFFWASVNRDGFCCEYNNRLELQLKNKSADVNFFYSFSSLLFYELSKTLKNSHKCLNCEKLLPKSSRSNYCPKENKKCWADRNRKKQHKHSLNQRKLTKT